MSPTSPGESVVLRFEQISADSPSRLAILRLSRPETANAFDAAMISSIAASLERVAKEKDIRALILYGQGKHFSAGADLAWMKTSASLGMPENLRDAEKLMAMFEALDNLAIPTIAIINGAAFGGAVGLAACCDIAIADESAKFCLSEVKLGILPAVIYPYLARKIDPGQLRRLSLTARIFSGSDALEFGLVQLTCNTENLDEVLRSEINGLLAAGPNAILLLKTLQRRVLKEGNTQGAYTAQCIASARVGSEAQSGFAAFFEKQTPPWFLKLEEDWTFNA